MTVREWKNFMWGLFALVVYATLVNVLGLKETSFYVACGIGIGIFGFFAYRLKHSSDKLIVKDYIENYSEKKSDRFDTNNYVLAIETSDKKLTQISSIVTENFGKLEIQDMLKLIEEWKKENNFVWDTSTVYDVIVIEGVIDEDKQFKTLVRRIQNTKFLKISGKLESKGTHKVVAKKDKKTDYFSKTKEDEVVGNLYTINGIDFCLTNVYPSDIDKMAVWSISIDTTKDGYYGVIVNREFKLLNEKEQGV